MGGAEARTWLVLAATALRPHAEKTLMVLIMIDGRGVGGLERGVTVGAWRGWGLGAGCDDGGLEVVGAWSGV